MARVRADDWGDKRQAILDEAAVLFARVGYASAKLVDVARACGASKSMLYHYFPKKEDVLFEIIREHAAGYLGAMEAVLQRPAPAEQRLREFVGMWLRRASAARARHAVLMYDLKFLPKRQQGVIVDIERRMIALLGQLVGELSPAVERGGPSLRKTYALLLLGLLNWTEVWFRSSGPMGAEEMSERISRLYLRGLATER